MNKPRYSDEETTSPDPLVVLPDEANCDWCVFREECRAVGICDLLGCDL